MFSSCLCTVALLETREGMQCRTVAQSENPKAGNVDVKCEHPQASRILRVRLLSRTPEADYS